jgi:hypothetical protein
MPRDLLAESQPKDLLADQKEYGWGDIAGDLGKGVEEAGRSIANFGLQVLSSPWTFNQALTQSLDDNPDTGFFTKTKQAQAIDDLIPVDAEDTEYTIPRGESDAIDMARDATRYGTEFLLSGGTSVLKHGAKGLAGTMAGAAAGGQVGDETGAALGSIAGGFAPLVEQFARRSWQTTKDVGRDVGKIANGIFNGDPSTLANASKADLRDAVVVLYNNAYPSTDIPLTPEYVDSIVDTVKKNIDAGQTGTLGQLSGDRGIIQYERDLLNTTNKTTERSYIPQHEQIQKDISQQGTAPVEEIAPTGIAEEAGVLPKARTQAEADRIREQGMEGAETVLAQARQAADEIPKPAESMLSQAQQAQEESLNALNIRNLQAATPEGYVIDKAGLEGFEQVKAAVKEQYDTAWANAEAIPADLAADLSGRLERVQKLVSQDNAYLFNNIKEDIDRLVEVPSPIGMSELDRSIGKLLNKSDITDTARTVLRNIRGELRKRLDPDAAALLAKADANYPRFLTMQNAVNKSNLQDYRPSSQEIGTASRNVGGGDPTRQPMRPEIAETQRIETLGQEAVDVAQEDLKAAQKSQADILRAGEAEATSVENIAEARAKQVEASPAAKFGQYESAEKAASQVFKSKTPTADLKQIVDTVKDDPQAVENLRRAFAKEFRNSIDNKGLLSREGYNTFKQRRQAYEESGLFTAEELDRIDSGMAEAQKLFVYDDTGKLAKLAPEERGLLDATAALAGAKIGAALMGSPLIGASIGRRTATRLLDRFGREQIDRLAQEMTLNPDKFVSIVKKLEQEGGVERIPPTKWLETFQELFKTAGITIAPKVNSEN